MALERRAHSSKLMPRPRTTIHSYWTALFAALLVTLALYVPTPAAAQSAIEVLRSEAISDFPHQIEFLLTAESRNAPITEVQLLYGATRSEALTIVDVPVAAAQRVQAQHTLNTRVYYSPPGTAMTFRWQIRDAAGGEYTSPAQTFFVHDERHRWNERTLGNLTIYWYRGGDAFGDALEGAAQRSLDVLRTEIGAELANPVRIYVYPSTEDMRSALQSNEVEWVGGQAWPGLGVIVAAIEPNNLNEVRRIIPHELSHQVLSQATDNPYGGVPLWFDEGLAVRVQETRDSDFDGLIDRAAREGRLIPLQALASSFPADPAQARLSYAQSRDVVEYIISVFGAAAVQDLVAAFREALPVDVALQTALNRSVDELDAEWRATLPRAELQPTPAPVQLRAPADRFSDPPLDPGAPPVAPGAPLQPAAPAAAQTESWFNGLADLPTWVTLGGLAFCLVIGVVFVGGVLLVTLRLIGVDKRTG
jgi:hypothetical protein